jgi:hypothetical protein
MIKIEKVQDGYLAHVTSPHVQEEWKSPTLSCSELVKELRFRGAHNQYLRRILRSGSELASESGLLMLGSLQEHEQNSDCDRPVRV